VLFFYILWYNAPTMMQTGDMEEVELLPCHQPASSSSVHYTTSCKETRSSAPEDCGNHRPKHVELVEVINKLSLLHLVGFLYYCINDSLSHRHQTYMKFVLIQHGIFIEINCD